MAADRWFALPDLIKHRIIIYSWGNHLSGGSDRSSIVLFLDNILKGPFSRLYWCDQAPFLAKWTELVQNGSQIHKCTWTQRRRLTHSGAVAYDRVSQVEFSECKWSFYIQGLYQASTAGAEGVSCSVLTRVLMAHCGTASTYQLCSIPTMSSWACIFALVTVTLCNKFKCRLVICASERMLIKAAMCLRGGPGWNFLWFCEHKQLWCHVQ